jgi:hypothetical protein
MTILEEYEERNRLIDKYYGYKENRRAKKEK